MPILKNDGVRQWEGWHPIYIMENKIHVWNHQPDLVQCSTSADSRLHIDRQPELQPNKTATRAAVLPPGDRCSPRSAWHASHARKTEGHLGLEWRYLHLAGCFRMLQVASVTSQLKLKMTGPWFGSLMVNHLFQRHALGAKTQWIGYINIY